MKKPIKQIICILLLLMCLLPLAVFVIAGPSASGANERLAAKPRLTAGGRLYNFDVLSDTADYFDGHFGLRQELITANAAADAAISREYPPRRRCCSARMAGCITPTHWPITPAQTL